MRPTNKSSINVHTTQYVEFKYVAYTSNVNVQSEITVADEMNSATTHMGRVSDKAQY